MDKKRFQEIMEEISILNNEALDLIPDGIIRERAQAYWYGHIQGAIGGEYNQYLGGSMEDMAGTLKDLEG